MTPRQWERRVAQMRVGADAARLCGYDGSTDGPEAERFFMAAEELESLAELAERKAWQ